MCVGAFACVHALACCTRPKQTHTTVLCECLCVLHVQGMRVPVGLGFFFLRDSFKRVNQKFSERFFQKGLSKVLQEFEPDILFEDRSLNPPEVVQEGFMAGSTISPFQGSFKGSPVESISCSG